MTGKFVCKGAADGGCRFDLLACNGQVILAGADCRNPASCLRAVESVRRSSVDPERFEERTSTDGKFSFVLKDERGRVLGTGRTYAGRAACRRGIASVQRHVVEAPLVEPAKP